MKKTQTPKKWGNQTDLAELMNVSRATITYYKKTGRMGDLIRPDEKINLKKALRVLPGRVAPLQQKSVMARLHKNKPEPTPEEINKYKTLTDDKLQELSISELQRQNELEKLLLARLKRQELEGNLIPGETVKFQAAECARLVKSILISIPDRLSSLLAVETDQNKIKAMLKVEFRNALEAMGTNDPSKIKQ